MHTLQHQPLCMASLPGSYSQHLPCQTYPLLEHKEVQWHAPATASVKNDVVHHCLALVSLSSLNQNFLFLYLLIGHFQVSFISAQVCWVFLHFLCAKRTLTKGSFTPLQVLFVSPNVTAVPPVGTVAVTQLQNWGLFLTWLLSLPLLSTLISSIKYSFHWLQEAGLHSFSSARVFLSYYTGVVILGTLLKWEEQGSSKSLSDLCQVLGGCTNPHEPSLLARSHTLPLISQLHHKVHKYFI